MCDDHTYIHYVGRETWGLEDRQSSKFFHHKSCVKTLGREGEAATGLFIYYLCTIYCYCRMRGWVSLDGSEKTVRLKHPEPSTDSGDTSPTPKIIHKNIKRIGA